jgi:hypothetical protein
MCVRRQDRSLGGGLSGKGLSVDGEQVECSGAVLAGGAGVGPDSLETGMAEEFGDDDEIGSAAHEGGGERVPEDMGSGVVVEPGTSGDPGDDVVGALDAQASTALVEEHRRAVGRPGPVGALVGPALERLAQLGWTGTWRTPWPLP